MRIELKMVYKRLGALIFDIPVYIRRMTRNRKGYLGITNRSERVSLGPSGKGYVCLWPYTSKLDAAILFPRLGQAVLKHSISEWGLKRTKERVATTECTMSVLIGHRGIERIGHLLTTIESLAAQKDVALECIVVEQDVESVLKDKLPKWVKHVLQRTEDQDDGYNRSAAFNYGMRYASGDIVLLHDNDMIVPEEYCREIEIIVGKGYQVVNIKRYVFYLDKQDSLRMMNSFESIRRCQPEYIVQNLEAGGSVAITRKGYQDIGGMDEGFIGWGGEDNEFWDRAAYLKRWIWGYLPVIHLWHESQRLKKEVNNVNVVRAKELARVNRKERIERLRSLNQYD